MKLLFPDIAIWVLSKTSFHKTSPTKCHFVALILFGMQGDAIMSANGNDLRFATHNEALFSIMDCKVMQLCLPMEMICDLRLITKPWLF